MRRVLPRLLRVGGVLLSVVPTAIAIFECFPVWVERGAEATVSGLAAVLLCLAAVPLFRLLRAHLTGPAIWPFWLFLWLLLVAVKKVIDGLIAVALVSFSAGLLGALLFRLAALIQRGGLRDER